MARAPVTSCTAPAHSLLKLGLEPVCECIDENPSFTNASTMSIRRWQSMAVTNLWRTVLQSLHMIPLQLLVFREISVRNSRRTWTPRYQIVRLYVGSLSASQNMTIRLRSDPLVLLQSAKMHGFGGPYRYQVNFSFAWTLEAAPSCRAGRIGLVRHDVHWTRATVGRYRPCGGALLAPPRRLGPKGGGRAWGWFRWA